MSDPEAICVWDQLPSATRTSLHRKFAQALNEHGPVVLDEMMLFILCMLDEQGEMDQGQAMLDSIRADIYRSTLHDNGASALAPHIEGEH